MRFIVICAIVCSICVVALYELSTELSGSYDSTHRLRFAAPHGAPPHRCGAVLIWQRQACWSALWSVVLTHLTSPADACKDYVTTYRKLPHTCRGASMQHRPIFFPRKNNVQERSRSISTVSTTSHASHFQPTRT